MAREVSEWELVAADNDFSVSDGGMPEGQQRTTVNDSTRERMRATRNWYESSAWHDLLNRYNLTWINATQFSVSHDTTPTDATAKFPVGARLRITHNSGATVTEGFVTARSFSSPNTTVTMEMDGAVALVNTVTLVEILVTRDELGRAAFVALGTAAGEVPQNSDLGDAAYEDQGTGNGLDADTVDGQHAQDIVDSMIQSPNLCLNPAMQLWQRGTTFNSATPGNWTNSNDTVLADGWGLLTQTADLVDVDQELSDVPGVAGAAVKFTGATVAAGTERFSWIHVLESKDTDALRGQEFTASCYAKAGAGTLDTIRITIMEWTGATNAATLDVVSAWGAAGADPTFVANWAASGATSSHSIDGTWTRYSTTATIGAGATHVAVLIIAEGTSWGPTDSLLLSGFDLVPGPNARAFRAPVFGEELHRCRRRFWKTFPYSFTPIENWGFDFGALHTNKHSTRSLWHNLAQEMAPFLSQTLTTYNPSAANVNFADGTAVSGSSASLGHLEIDSVAAAGDTYIHATFEVRPA